MILSVGKKYIMTFTVEQIESTHNPAVTRNNYYPVRAYWVPIELREQVLAAYRETNTRVRLRYRGPRAVSIGREMTRNDKTTYLRSRTRAMQDCLIADATHFTVYDYTAR
jgi:hypothetical protein